MAVQLIVRTTMAILRRRSAAKALRDSTADAAGAESPAAPAASTSKNSFTVDGRPLATAFFDPDDPDQASAYPDEEEGEGARDRRCTLCLGTRRDATATECGHVCTLLMLAFEAEAMMQPFADVFLIVSSSFLSLHSLLGVHCWLG